MLAQELFGLLQRSILGRMQRAHGLTTNRPNDGKLLRHVISELTAATQIYSRMSVRLGPLEF